ncbi:MAG: hypothetical protein ACRC28_05000 [Clostridium sp.]|uniref:hypothetical protein n=1 Tax=Clostridium sp. TaxID=1506 RepID=UPI003F2EC62C
MKKELKDSVSFRIEQLKLGCNNLIEQKGRNTMQIKGWGNRNTMQIKGRRTMDIKERSVFYKNV